MPSAPRGPQCPWIRGVLGLEGVRCSAPSAARGALAPRTAGAFDVRNVIAALIAFYGIVLIIMGLVADSATQRAKTGDVNTNL